MRQIGLFGGGERLQMTESIQLTIDSLLTYGPSHEHWAIAWSGGKDSTTLLTLVIYLIDTGKVPRPKTLTIFYADTRLELLPLWIAARDIRDELEVRGIEVRVVMAPLDKRFLVYILGRGVPPPNNNTLRWCTRQIKIDPMAAELRRLHGERGTKVLMLTGVRQGEIRRPRDPVVKHIIDPLIGSPARVAISGAALVGLLAAGVGWAAALLLVIAGNVAVAIWWGVHLAITRRPW